jgi:hypothetical protein
MRNRFGNVNGERFNRKPGRTVGRETSRADLMRNGTQAKVGDGSNPFVRLPRHKSQYLDGTAPEFSVASVLQEGSITKRMATPSSCQCIAHPCDCGQAPPRVLDGPPQPEAIRVLGKRQTVPAGVEERQGKNKGKLLALAAVALVGLFLLGGGK